jgi:hypothetical protein
LDHTSVRFTHFVKPVGINLHIVRGARRQRRATAWLQTEGSELHLSKIVQTRSEGLSLLPTMTAPPAQMSEWQRFHDKVTFPTAWQPKGEQVVATPDKAAIQHGG